MCRYHKPGMLFRLLDIPQTFLVRFVQSHLCTVNMLVHSLNVCCRALAGSAKWIHPQCIAVWQWRCVFDRCVTWRSSRRAAIRPCRGCDTSPRTEVKHTLILFLYFCHCFSQRCLIVAKYLQCSADDERLVLSAEVKLFCEKRMFRTDACEMVKHR